jgi:hypothetical protein
VLTIPAPAALHGDALTDELHAAGFSDVEVTLVGDQVEISGVSESDRTKVEQVVAAHAPPPPLPDPDDDLAARVRAVYDAAPAGPAKDLCAALLGIDGDAAVAGRPTST